MIYVLLGILIIVEIISGIEVVKSVDRFCNADNQSMDERTNVLDSDGVLHVHGRYDSRGSDTVDIGRMDAETAKNALTVMRMSVKYSETEKDAIDYAIICIDVAQKLSKYLRSDAK